MTRTILVFVVAVVLGAVLAWYLKPCVSPSVEEEAETTAVSPAAEHRRAVVFVDDDADCEPETLPQVIFARVGDTISWRLKAVEGCAGYADELDIALKDEERDRGSLAIPEDQQGPTVEGRIADIPAECEDGVCSIYYSVTVTGTEGSKTEDPKIEIWP